MQGLLVFQDATAMSDDAMSAKKRLKLGRLSKIQSMITIKKRLFAMQIQLLESKMQLLLPKKRNAM